MKFMKIIFTSLCFVGLTTSLAADIDKQVTSEQRGGFATAFFNEIRNIAEEGHARAQFKLGAMYFNGEGVAQDHKQAVYWLEQAAKQGHTNAQFNLGAIYSDGEGVAQDHKQAVYWFEQAAKQGHTKAQFNLGSMYSNGEVVAQDHKQAVYWFEQAAKQGLTKAQFILGYSYFKGEGVLQDFIQAHKWFNIASANGHEESRNARDKVVAPKMTTAQIQQAQALAHAFLAGETTTTQSQSEKNSPSSTVTTGTGFIIAKSGELVTNAHVIQNCKTISVELGKQTLPAQILAVDHNNDMAILKTNLKANPASIVIGRVALGQAIYAAGYPLRGLLGQDLQLTNGIVSGLNGIQNDYRYYQINAAVQSGNSGGPLLNEQGQVLGIVSMKLNVEKVAQLTGDLPQNVNFAIKSSQLVGFLDANQVEYQVGGQSKSLNSTEVAELARNFTTFLTCYQ